jgi:lipopolysaccharide heptosyltransferase II
VHPSILILRLSSLGDIILTTPLLIALREQFPKSVIDLVISKEFESLIPIIPAVSTVHIYDKSAGPLGVRELRRSLKEPDYNYVLDLHNVLRTRILRRGLGRHTRVINKRTFKRWLLVKFKLDRLQNEPDVIGRYFETTKVLEVKDSGKGPILNVRGQRDPKRIAIAPGARHWNKRWPANYFASVAKSLIDNRYHIDLHGSENDASICKMVAEQLPPQSFVNFAGKLSLEDVAREIARASAIVTNDSGLMHVAEAVGTRIVSIFGPTVRQFGFAPRSANAVVVEVQGLYCRPCTAIGLDHCPEKHFRCMMEIEPEQVLTLLNP